MFIELCAAKVDAEFQISGFHLGYSEVRELLEAFIGFTFHLSLLGQLNPLNPISPGSVSVSRRFQTSQSPLIPARCPWNNKPSAPVIAACRSASDTAGSLEGCKQKQADLAGSHEDPTRRSAVSSQARGGRPEKLQPEHSGGSLEEWRQAFAARTGLVVSGPRPVG
jgi:hypothetical protein